MNYLSDNLWIVWAIVVVGTMIMEMMVGGFFLLCFSFGALISAVTSLCGLSVEGQILVFCISSLLSLFFIRPVVAKFLSHKKEGRHRTSGVEALVGRIGVVSETIPVGRFGRVTIDGDDWKAQSNESEPLPAGCQVEVLSNESIIITVKKVG